MKNYILFFTLVFTSVLSQEQNIPHDIKILKEEMKEIKHYLYELKETINLQDKVINTLTNQIKTQEQEIATLRTEMNQKIELLNEGSLFQEERIKTLTKEVEGLQNNTRVYVQKLDLLAFFESLDPNRVTVLQYLRNYGSWIVNHS
jgi:septal ring factor EnvC (AmiA/AmiB activator)